MKRQTKRNPSKKNPCKRNLCKKSNPAEAAEEKSKEAPAYRRTSLTKRHLAFRRYPHRNPNENT